MSDEQFFNRFLDRIIGPDLPGESQEPEGENKVWMVMMKATRWSMKMKAMLLVE